MYSPSLVQDTNYVPIKYLLNQYSVNTFWVSLHNFFISQTTTSIIHFWHNVASWVFYLKLREIPDR